MPCPLSALSLRARRAGVSAVLVILCLALPGPASATKMTFFDVGVSPEGTPIQVSATLATATDAWGPDNSLRITLASYGAPTKYAVDVLTSFYFDLLDPLSGTRPKLTYVSGSGSAFEVRSGSGNDRPISWTPQIWTPGSTAASNLVALRNFDEGWQFKMFDQPQAYGFLSFGIGTVGNSGIDDFFPGVDASFNGRVVSGTAPGSMINLGIYSVGGGSDIDPAGVLNGARLIRTMATFEFLADRSLTNVSRQWVPQDVAFGFGTNPELVLLPEPGTLPMAAAAVIGGMLWRLLKRRRRPSAGVSPGEPA